MSTNVHRAKVGAIVLGAIALLLAAFVGVGAVDWFDDRVRYRAVYHGSVDGLVPGAAVKVRGVDVGDVVDVELTRDVSRPIVVTMAVEPGTPIREGATAQLSRVGVTSLKAIDITGGTGEFLEPGAVLDGEQDFLARAANQGERLVTRIEALLIETEELVENVEQLTDERTQERIEGILSQVETIVARGSSISKKLDVASSAITALVGDARRQLAQSNAAIQRAATSVEGLASEADAALDEGGETIATLSELVQGNRYRISSILRDIDAASENLRELAMEVRARPSRLLRSNPPEPRELPD